MYSAESNLCVPLCVLNRTANVAKEEKQMVCECALRTPRDNAHGKPGKGREEETETRYSQTVRDRYSRICTVEDQHSRCR